MLKLIRNWWDRISYIGIDKSTSGQEERTILFLNRISVIVWLFVFTSILINIIIGNFLFIPVLCLTLALLSLIYFFNARKLYWLAKSDLLISLIGLLSYMTFKAGFGAGLEFYFLSLTVLPVIIFRKNRNILFFQAICIIALIAQKFYAWKYPHFSDLFAKEYVIFYVVNSIYSILLIVLAIMFFRNINIKNEKHLINIKDQLEESNKQLDAFVYSISHDLRSPLRTISGLAGILTKKYSEKIDKDGMEVLNEIQESSKRMNVLVNNLLVLSRADKQEIKMQALDMNLLLNKVLNELGHELIDSNTKIIKHDLPGINADETLMKQVLMNLLSNAIKYSSKQELPEIEIGADKAGENVNFYIKDNGVGFDMQFADKLFQVFQRLHNHAEFEGTGIGLAIVMNNILRHGGKIWAESTVGKGATFYFSVQAFPGH